MVYKRGAAHRTAPLAVGVVEVLEFGDRVEVVAVLVFECGHEHVLGSVDFGVCDDRALRRACGEFERLFNERLRQINRESSGSHLSRPFCVSEQQEKCRIVRACLQGEKSWRSVKR